MDTRSLLSVDEMERAYLRSDPAYDGLFVLGVKTTGIFCRPVCPARKPFPRNVEYFARGEQAIAAGYRACKRCRPLAMDDRPAWAEALLAEVEADPARRITDKDLKARGIDPATVRRDFHRRFGMTFQAYHRARRLSGVLTRLQGGEAVDEVVYSGGYESHSGFREAFARTFGAPPGEADQLDCVRLVWLPSPLGPVVAGSVDEGVCLVEFAEPDRVEAQLRTLRRYFDRPIVPGDSPHLDRIRDELASYFAGTLREFTVPVVDPGTSFQCRVWATLRTIPYGETWSYEQLAQAVGSPKAVRAVGSANGRNRLAILTPCHRVVNKGGGLGGYAGGLRRKEYLLRLEREAKVAES